MVVPWRCQKCDENAVLESQDKKATAPLVVLACQACHRHGPVVHVGFAGGPPSHVDIDALGSWSNVVRAYEDDR